MKFEELNISDSLKQAIKSKGFEKPSEVQEQVIPAALAGKDLVGKSKTGTGKTAAFAIPLIEMVQQGKPFSALVVVPTRELCVQVKDEIASIAQGSRINTFAVFGGQSISGQATGLRRKPEIIVGTPGRLLDLLSRRMLSFSQAQFLVLDEADKMFDMGFRFDIERIVSYFPKYRQTMLFSATMPKEILALVEKHMKPDKIVFDLSEDNAPVESIEQFYVKVSQKQKVDTLCSILVKEKDSKNLVFCRTKRTVDWLEKLLGRHGIRVFAIHGDRQQNSRKRTIDEFTRSEKGILLATDIVARGIHVDDIDNVINFDLPTEAETYIHRIGRTARQGKKGRAISFCTNPMDVHDLSQVAAYNNSHIAEWRF